jgi:uncharacterized Ntn-hydrolase superfamily protein
VKQPEDEDSSASGRLKAQEAAEPVHVVKGLVNDRKTDDRVYQIAVRVNAAEHSAEQRETVTQGEEADVLDDILQPVEEKDNADKKQQVVVSGHHVLGAQVHQRTDRGALNGLQEQRVFP